MVTVRPVVCALCALAPAVAQAQPITAQQLAATKALVTRAVDEVVEVPGGIAGYSVVIAADGEPDFILTRGFANAATKETVTPYTAFYIASQTKSYTGLLAAQLDRKKVLPLDTTLATIWPDMRLPFPIESSKVTLRQLLSHSGGFDNPVLGERTAYTDAVPAADYPRLLEAASTVNEPGFHYSNLGYLIYSAALEKWTGRDWKSWLGSDVFRPLGLEHTYSRSSRVPAERVAWGHQWDGQAWVPIQPKDDSIMHAAGGLFASSRDLAKWIRWQLALGAGQEAIPSDDFLATRTDLAAGGIGEGGFGISCNGYSLGWGLCTFEGERLLYHGGAYTGVRTHLFVLPERNVGVALLANSDGMTGGLGQFFMSAIASSLLGKPEAPERVAQMIAGYRDRVARQVANRKNEAAANEADSRWGGWAWQPGPDQLARYVGTYRSDRFGDLVVRSNGGQLTASLGVLRRDLRPAAEELFAVRATPVELWEPVKFVVAAGKVEGVDFAGKTFARVRR